MLHLASFLHLPGKKGFTLIELLVTFTMVAIISGMGFASFASYSRRQTVVQASYDVKQSIDEARFAALSSVKSTVLATAAPDQPPVGFSSVCPEPSNLISYQFKICQNMGLGSECEENSNSDYEVVANCTNDGLSISSSPVVSRKVLPPGVTFSDVDEDTRCGDPITFNTLNSNTTGVPCKVYA